MQRRNAVTGKIEHVHYQWPKRSPTRAKRVRLADLVSENDEEGTDEPPPPESD